jgi:flagellar protein FlaJ
MIKRSISGDISLERLGQGIGQQRKVINEMNSLFNYLENSDSAQEKKMISSQIEALVNSMRKSGQQILQAAERISMFKRLNPSEKTEQKEPEKNKQAPQQTQSPKSQPQPSVQQTQTQEQTQKTNPQVKKFEGREEKSPGEIKREKEEAGELEKLTLQRFKKKEKKEKVVKEKKPSVYAKISSSLFGKLAKDQLKKGYFRRLSRDLVKSNLNFVPVNYVSAIYFTTLISIFISLFIMGFFFFFNLVASPPFFVRAEDSFGLRLLKVFWIIIVGPLITFLSAYFYPNLEKKSIETKINREIPYAAIHMSSISSSMIDPSKIFGIIASTKEYPNLEKEFIKLQNEINIYGYDLVTALRNRGYNSPSKKLSELFNGLATTITSGGDLPGFFEKRSQTLLFEHRLDEEKQTKASETFMDIYISVVIAAPMILMLLLMMMRISGLGLTLSTGTITLVMMLGVTLVNILFLTFLQLRQPGG